MQNDPTGTSDRHSAYYDAMREADDDLADALVRWPRTFTGSVTPL
jgi:hypothetical protein